MKTKYFIIKNIIIKKKKSKKFEYYLLHKKI